MSSNWADEKVVCLITPHFMAQQKGWCDNVQIAVQRGALKKIYVAFASGPTTISIVEELAKRLETCAAHIVTQRAKNALVKVLWLNKIKVEAV